MSFVSGFCCALAGIGGLAFLKNAGVHLSGLRPYRTYILRKVTCAPSCSAGCAALEFTGPYYGGTRDESTRLAWIADRGVINRGPNWASTTLETVGFPVPRIFDEKILRWRQRKSPERQAQLKMMTEDATKDKYKDCPAT